MYVSQNSATKMKPNTEFGLLILHRRKSIKRNKFMNEKHFGFRSLEFHTDWMTYVQYRIYLV